MRVMSEQTVKVTKNPTKVPHITSIKAFVSGAAQPVKKIKITAKKPPPKKKKIKKQKPETTLA